MREKIDKIEYQNQEMEKDIEALEKQIAQVDKE